MQRKRILTIAAIAIMIAVFVALLWMDVVNRRRAPSSTSSNTNTSVTGTVQQTKKKNITKPEPIYGVYLAVTSPDEKRLVYLKSEGDKLLLQAINDWPDDSSKPVTENMADLSYLGLGLDGILKAIWSPDFNALVVNLSYPGSIVKNNPFYEASAMEGDEIIYLINTKDKSVKRLQINGFTFSSIWQDNNNLLYYYDKGGVSNISSMNIGDSSWKKVSNFPISDGNRNFYGLNKASNILYFGEEPQEGDLSFYKIGLGADSPQKEFIANYVYAVTSPDRKKIALFNTEGEQSSIKTIDTDTGNITNISLSMIPVSLSVDNQGVVYYFNSDDVQTGLSRITKGLYSVSGGSTALLSGIDITDPVLDIFKVKDHVFYTTDGGILNKLY